VNRLLSRGVALAAVLVCACVACGGRVDPGDDGGAGSGSSSTSSSGGGASGGGTGSTGSEIVPPCPDWPPTPGTACVGPNGCAYYTNGACSAFVCNASSEWQTTPEGC
jgi:hypothetical protein